MTAQSLNGKMSRCFLIALLSGVVTLLLCAASMSVHADVIDDLLGQESAEEAAVEPGSIEVDNDIRSDNAIRNRLQGIYAELESLESVEVSVSNGVVTLAGEVVSAQSAERASRLAAQVVGVIEVQDEMTVDTDVTRRVESTLQRLQAFFYDFIAALPVLLLALSVIVLFWLAGRRIGRHRRLFLLVAPNGFIAELLATVARVVCTLLGLVLALTLLDATSILGSVLGAAGIVGLAIGFAVRDTVENFIASILLSLRTPFLARDYVRIGEHEGAVARLTSRATILISRDGNQVRVPNALVYKSVIVNFSRQPQRRFEFVVGVDTDLDLNTAQRTAIAAIYRIDGVLEKPAATALIKELGDSSVSLLVAAWIDQTQSDLMKVRSESIRAVKQAFDDAGIVMPEPIYRVHLREGWGKPAVPKKPQAKPATELRQPEPETDTVAPGHESVSDTTVDQAIQDTIDRELADSDSENLLGGKSRQE